MRKLFLMLAVLATAGCTITRTPSINATKEIPIDLGNQSARACAISIFEVIGPFGDNSIAKAARNAGISTISYYEKSNTHYILWGEYCNTVYGYANGMNNYDYSSTRNRWKR